MAHIYDADPWGRPIAKNDTLNPPAPTPEPFPVRPDGLFTLSSGRRMRLRRPNTLSTDELNQPAEFRRPGVDDRTV